MDKTRPPERKLPVGSDYCARVRRLNRSTNVQHRDQPADVVVVSWARCSFLKSAVNSPRKSSRIIAETLPWDEPERESR